MPREIKAKDGLIKLGGRNHRAGGYRGKGKKKRARFTGRGRGESRSKRKGGKNSGEKGSASSALSG